MKKKDKIKVKYREMRKEGGGVVNEKVQARERERKVIWSATRERKILRGSRKRGNVKKQEKNRLRERVDEIMQAR